MANKKCPKCGFEMTDASWGCPRCQASSDAESEEDGEGLTESGMWALLWLCIFFPVLLYLLHIFVPGM